ncbi:MAG: LysR family transcriptional regulator [Myxococcota bacterium]
MEWSDLPFFLAVVRDGSMTAAARRLGVAPTTVGRRVAALEDALGFRLFDRTPDGPVLTEKGERFASLSRGVEAEMHQLERALQTQAASAGSTEVRITATEGVCAEIVAPSLSELCRGWPELRVTLRAQPSVVSLARREADLAVRMRRPTDGLSLVARRLGELSLGLYARHPVSDFAAARFVGYDDSYGPIDEVRLFEEVHDRVVLRSSSTRVLLRATLDGIGIGLLPTFLARRYPQLQPVDLGWELPRRTLWLVYHEDLRTSVAVRRVADHLAGSFEQVLQPASDTLTREATGGDAPT